ncbi:MAG: isochorismatase family protein [Steroidobacterales bacterium]
MTPRREEDYRSAGFSGALGFGKTPALIVIDMMMSYFERSSPMYAGVEAVAASNLRLIGAARARQIPVFFTRQVHDRSADATVYARKVPALKLLHSESPLAELHPSLPTNDATVIVKRYPSAFYRTDLASRLLALKVDTLILTGLTTSGCVRATAMDTLLNDLTGIVVREAVGDRDRHVHEANLFDIDAKLADVRSEADVIGWIEGR